MDIAVREAIFTSVKKWVYEAGDIIRSRMKDPLIIHMKTDEKDLVTELDKEIEVFFTDKIRNKYPAHYIISEEGYGDDFIDKSATVWFIDPIDGTTNFIHQKRNFAISIGIYHAEVGEIGFIYDVNADLLFSAKNGEGAYRNETKLPKLAADKNLTESVLSFNHRWLMEREGYDRRVMESLLGNIRSARTFGSAALEFAYVAEGAIDAYFKESLEPWDIAAGMILVNEVGGITTNLFGEQCSVFQAGSILTSNEEIHESLVTDYLLKAKK